MHGIACGSIKPDSKGSVRARIGELLERPLRDAKAAGTVRRDLTVADVFLIFAMARGAMEGLPDRAARSAVAHRVMSLTLSGVEA